MLQMIYTSSAAVPLATSDLQRLAGGARTRNASEGITGLLIFHDNAFLQVLEGDDVAVEATWSRISQDPRHRWLQVLCRSSISRRLFGEWPLGFVNDRSHQLESLPGFCEFLHRKGAPSREDGIAAVRLLTEFRYGRWRKLVETGQILPGVLRRPHAARELELALPARMLTGGT